MLSYIFKRILSLIPVLFVVSVVIFSIVHLTPGDPARVILGPEASPDQVATLREQMGFNRPIVVQYLSWLGAVLQGDFGDSIFMRMPVTQAIANHAAPTLSLAILAQLFTIAVAVPLGILAARKRGTFFDQGVMGITLIGMAIPSFLLGLLLVLLVGVELGWLPVAGYRPLSDGLGEHLKYLILPAISLGTIQSALIARMTRSSMLDVLKVDYIRTAKAKGMRERRIIYRHALRNAAMPILTVIGVTFGGLVTGAVVTETIFNLPGLGQLIVNSINRRDYAVIQGVVLFVTLVYVLLNLLIDLLYGVVDPRVRLQGKAR